jgi:hypothetical protein
MDIACQAMLKPFFKPGIIHHLFEIDYFAIYVLVFLPQLYNQSRIIVSVIPFRIISRKPARGAFLFFNASTCMTKT